MAAGSATAPAITMRRYAECASGALLPPSASPSTSRISRSSPGAAGRTLGYDLDAVARHRLRRIICACCFLGMWSEGWGGMRSANSFPPCASGSPPISSSSTARTRRAALASPSRFSTTCTTPAPMLSPRATTFGTSGRRSCLSRGRTACCGRSIIPRARRARAPGCSGPRTAPRCW